MLQKKTTALEYLMLNIGYNKLDDESVEKFG